MKSIIEKANYCIGCINKPCSKACPLNNDTAGFIKLIKEDKLKEAYNLLSETTILESICGRICPHTKQCEGKCIRGIKGEPVSIGELEAYIGDLAIKNNWSFTENIEERKEKVAIIGSGSWGVALSIHLAKQGHNVKIWSFSQEECDLINNEKKSNFLSKVQITFPDVHYRSKECCLLLR